MSHIPGIIVKNATGGNTQSRSDSLTFNVSTETLSTTNLSVTTGSLTVGSSGFVVDGYGNITKINDVEISFPDTQGEESTVLTNDGYGNLSWATGTVSGTGAPSRLAVWNGTSSQTSYSGLTFDASNLIVAGAAASSGANVAFTLTAPAHTNQTTGTEVSTVLFDFSSTMNHAPGGITTQRDFLIKKRSHSGDTGTIGTAATLAIEGAPTVSGPDFTATNRYTLWVQEGQTTLSNGSSTDAILDLQDNGTSTWKFLDGGNLRMQGDYDIFPNTAGHGEIGTSSFPFGSVYANGITVGSTGGLSLDSSSPFSTAATTPSTLNSDQNDYNPGTGSLFRIASSTEVVITGLANGADGRQIQMINSGSFSFALSHQSTSSSAANRIITPTGFILIIPPNGTVNLRYDNSASRWRVINIIDINTPAAGADGTSIFAGYLSGSSVTSATGCSGFGYNSGSAITSGANNTAFGNGALSSGSFTGSNVTCIGFNAEPASSSTSDQIVFGDANVFSCRFGTATITAPDPGVTFNSLTNLPVMRIGHSIDTANQKYIEFFSNGVSLGSVSQDAVGGVSILYNTTSDYRLKNEIGSIERPIDRLMELRPLVYEFKSKPGHAKEGFIAHEVQEIISSAVTGKKDEIDDEGNIIPQQIDHSKMLPLVVAALQEAIKTIYQIKKEILDLKSK